MDALRRDPFLEDFYSKIPAGVAATFTDSQLDAIKRAYGHRTRGSHAVDLRFSIPLPFRRFYVVFLAGRERRATDRRLVDALFQPLWTVANGVVVLFLVLMLLMAAAGLLYTAKRALHINVFPSVDMLPDEKIERFLRL